MTSGAASKLAIAKAFTNKPEATIDPTQTPVELHSSVSAAPANIEATTAPTPAATASASAALPDTVSEASPQTATLVPATWSLPTRAAPAPSAWQSISTSIMPASVGQASPSVPSSAAPPIAPAHATMVQEVATLTTTSAAYAEALTKSASVATAAVMDQAVVTPEARAAMPLGRAKQVDADASSGFASDQHVATAFRYLGTYEFSAGDVYALSVASTDSEAVTGREMKFMAIPMGRRLSTDSSMKDVVGETWKTAAWRHMRPGQLIQLPGEGAILAFALELDATAALSLFTLRSSRNCAYVFFTDRPTNTTADFLHVGPSSIKDSAEAGPSKDSQPSGISFNVALSSFAGMAVSISACSVLGFLLRRSKQNVMESKDIEQGRQQPNDGSCFGQKFNRIKQGLNHVEQHVQDTGALAPGMDVVYCIASGIAGKRSKVTPVDFIDVGNVSTDVASVKAGLGHMTQCSESADVSSENSTSSTSSTSYLQ